jgi:transcriptional regulator with XRE-family HTH domain
MKPFRELLRERRKELGLTQKAVAERIGATASYISLLESGKSLPPPRPMVKALAYALQMDPESLWQAAYEERKQRFLQKAHGRASRRAT